MDIDADVVTAGVLVALTQCLEQYKYYHVLSVMRLVMDLLLARVGKFLLSVARYAPLIVLAREAADEFAYAGEEAHMSASVSSSTIFSYTVVQLNCEFK